MAVMCPLTGSILLAVRLPKGLQKSGHSKGVVKKIAVLRTNFSLWWLSIMPAKKGKNPVAMTTKQARARKWWMHFGLTSSEVRAAEGSW